MSRRARVLRVVAPQQLLLLLLLLLSRSGSPVLNNATETVDTAQLQDSQAESISEDTNQARNGGRRLADAVRSGADQSQVGCKELRSTKYISDGQCTSVEPIKELVCAGECLPANLLPNWIGSGGYTGRYWNRRDTKEWRCIIDKSRTERIQLQCHDGSSRTYKITVVISCKCKHYSREQNDSGHKDTSVQGGKQTAGHREEGAGRQSNS